MQVVFLPAATKDIRNSYDWFEKRQIGLGSKFSREVIYYLRKIEKDSIEYRKYFAGIQSVRLRKFPFSIYFIKENEKLTVIAVLFNRRDVLNILQKR